MKIYKVIIPLLLLLFYTPDLSAQDTVLTFYNRELQVIKKKNEEGFYIKSSQDGKFHYKENRTGKDILQSRQWDTIEGNGLKKGHYIEYAQGIKVMEGNSLNDQKNGTWISWYQDGSTKAMNDYIEGVRHGKWITWHKNHKENSIGYYAGDLKSGLWTSWFENGKLSSIVNFEDELETMIPEIKSDTSLYYMIKRNEGLFDGNCYWFLPSGDTAVLEIYKKGKLQSVFLYNADKKDNIPIEKYKVMEKAKFKGDINTYLKENIQYPETVGNEKIQGQAIVEFTVTEDGSVLNIRVIKGSGYFELDREVVRAVSETKGNWSPGLVHNVPHATQYLLPVTFKPKY